jgi:hypothetical protein
MEDSISGPKLDKHFNLDNINFNAVDDNDNIPTNIGILDVEIIK